MKDGVHGKMCKTILQKTRAQIRTKFFWIVKKRESTNSNQIFLIEKKTENSKSTISKSINVSYEPLMKPDTCLSCYERLSSWKIV